MNVEITGLTRRFGRTMAVAGVDLRAGPGVFGLLGPNGAGKTSLLRMMATAIPPTSGTLRLLGRDPGSYGPRREIRRRLGYLPQNLGYYPGFTVAEFVEYFALLKEVPAAQIPAAVAAAIERVELGDRAKSKLRTLSGGMLRRVGIAQAIVNEPELLLLDEPTAGLDPEQRVAFRALLRDLGQRATVVVSTHLVEDVGAACTQVALMDRGKIVFHGTPQDLTARGEGHATGDAPLERGYSAVLAAATVMSAVRAGPAGLRGPAWPSAGRCGQRRGCCALSCGTTRCCGCSRWPPACSGSPPTARPWPCRRCGTRAPPPCRPAPLLVFVCPVAGAAAWMGSREARRRTTDLVTITARPRCARQLVTWAATTGWAMLAYLGCVAVLYGVTAQQATGGGPLWWPVAVGAASLAALSALGFAAGALAPSRFTGPLASIAAFFALALSTQLISGSQSYWVISPVVAAPWDLGPDPGVAIFYPYLPDLPIAQVMFLAGLTAAVLGALALPRDSGRRSLRAVAAAVTAAGLLAAGTAVALAGTGKLDAHGMIAIPALHDAASDRPIHFTPVCSHTAIPVCLNPAYASYLPARRPRSSRCSTR